MIYIHMNNYFANQAESSEDSDQISRENLSSCVYGFLLKEVAYRVLRNSTPKGVTKSCLHTCSHVCVGNSKNKMLSFLFLESDFSNLRLLLCYTKSQLYSPISDEENNNMTNSIRAYEERKKGIPISETIVQFPSQALICEILLGGISPTKQE